MTLNDLKALIKFAKEQGITKVKCGDFECDLPPRDATQKELDAINKRLTQLDAIAQRLSLSIEKPTVRDMSKPFTARIANQGKSNG